MVMHAGRPAADRQHRHGAGVTRFAWGAATDIGRVRQANEDIALRRPTALFAVADGMGGHQGGEVASDLAIDDRCASDVRPTPHHRRARRGRCSWPTTRSSARPPSDPDLAGHGHHPLRPGASCTVDGTRAPRHRQRRRLPRLPARRTTSSSRSPTTTAWWPRSSARVGSPAAEAAVHPQRNILTRALGIDARVMVDSWEVAARRRRPLPALQRRPVQRGRREPHRRHAAHARRPRPTRPASWCAWPTRAAGATTSPWSSSTCSTTRATTAGATAPRPPTPTGSSPPCRARPAWPRGPSPGDLADDRPARADAGPKRAPPGGARPRPAGRHLARGAVRRRRPGRRRPWPSAPSPTTGATPTSSGFDDDAVVIFQGRPGGVLWIEPEVVERTAAHPRRPCPAGERGRARAGQDRADPRRRPPLRRQPRTTRSIGHDADRRRPPPTTAATVTSPSPPAGN